MRMGTGTCASIYEHFSHVYIASMSRGFNFVLDVLITVCIDIIQFNDIYAGLDHVTPRGMKRPFVDSPNSGSGSSAKGDVQKVGTVVVSDNGAITTTCSGKNRWQNDFRLEVLRWLDVSVISFADQNAVDWTLVCQTIKDRWVYEGNNGHGVANACLEKYAMRVLKTERSKLRMIWKSSGGGKSVPPPPSVEPAVWARLLTYFLGQSGQSKSEQMSLARAQVQNMSCTGRKGNAPIIESLVRISFEITLLAVFMDFQGQ